MPYKKGTRVLIKRGNKMIRTTITGWFYVNKTLYYTVKSSGKGKGKLTGAGLPGKMITKYRGK